MYFEDIVVGTELDLEPVEITKERMLEFAHTYDSILIHTDEEYAKTTHFKDLIAPGVMTFMSVWKKYLDQDLYKTELLCGLSTKIEWKKPVYAGDILTGHAVVTNKWRRNKKNGVSELTIYIYNQNGDLALTDVTESVIKCRTEND